MINIDPKALGFHPTENLSPTDPRAQWIINEQGLKTLENFFDLKLQLTPPVTIWLTPAFMEDILIFAEFKRGTKFVIIKDLRLPDHKLVRPLYITDHFTEAKQCMLQGHTVIPNPVTLNINPPIH